MDSDTTTFGLSPEYLANLLSLGLEGGEGSKSSQSEELAKLIRAHLAGPLPPATVVIDALPILLGAMRRELLPQDGRPVSELLLDGDTPLEVIVQVKDYGKRLAVRSEPNRSVGIAIYYTSIASAIVFHDKKITKHAYGYLADSFKALDRGWMTMEMERHICKAERACRKRGK